MGNDVGSIYIPRCPRGENGVGSLYIPRCTWGVFFFFKAPPCPFVQSFVRPFSTNVQRRPSRPFVRPRARHSFVRPDAKIFYYIFCGVGNLKWQMQKMAWAVFISPAVPGAHFSTLQMRLPCAIVWYEMAWAVFLSPAGAGAFFFIFKAAPRPFVQSFVRSFSTNVQRGPSRPFVRPRARRPFVRPDAKIFYYIFCGVGNEK